MQVVTTEPGHAHCSGRGEMRRVRTALVGDVVRDEWLLVFIDSAQERISAVRAQEINATLDLMEAVLRGDHPNTDPAFALPSIMSREQLLILSGASQSPPVENPLEY